MFVLCLSQTFSLRGEDGLWHPPCVVSMSPVGGRGRGVDDSFDEGVLFVARRLACVCSWEGASALSRGKVLYTFEVCVKEASPRLDMIRTCSVCVGAPFPSARKRVRPFRACSQFLRFLLTLVGVWTLVGVRGGGRFGVLISLGLRLRVCDV